MGFILNIFKNLIGVFHALIIASLLLSLSGCGYKDAPYYSEEAPAGDENVKFIMKQKSFDNENNESCAAK